MTKLSLAILALAAASLIAGAQHASAQKYPYSYRWCAGSLGDPTSNCGFNSFQQCMAFTEGFGGSVQCSSNPNFRGAPAGRHARNQ